MTVGRITRPQRLAASLWWGSGRRPLEALLRRLVSKEPRILTGPLRGCPFDGGLAQILGVYELSLQVAIADSLAEGDLFLDVGGFNGFFSLLGSRIVGDSGQVLVFEPSTSNRGALIANLEANRARNVEVSQKAVSRAGGEACLSYGDQMDPTSSLMVGGDKTTTVATCSLDEVVEDLKRFPTLIKIDAEGAEGLILDGAREVLAQRASKWIVETHSDLLERDVEKRFLCLGYECSVLPPMRFRSGNAHIKASPRRPGALKC